MDNLGTKSLVDAAKRLGIVARCSGRFLSLRSVFEGQGGPKIMDNSCRNPFKGLLKP